MQNISRRAALGAATLGGFPELFGLKGIGRVRAQGTMADDDLQTIINLASTTLDALNAVIFEGLHRAVFRHLFGLLAN